MTVKPTPMLQQYLSIKEQYPDTLLFYRMGDFYEMFFNDAEVASRVLEITLTSRNKNDETPVPMCGVPFRAVQGYIARLIENGFKVAICDQVEDAGKAKGLVKREVVRVITPGMIFESEFLDAKANNYVLSLAFRNGTIGLASLDVSTATFRLAESPDRTVVMDEIARISPAEILLPASTRQDLNQEPMLRFLKEHAVTDLEDTAFEPAEARERLIRQFQTLSLEGFGCESMTAGIAAAGALLHYVTETQKQPVDHVHGIETYSLSDFMTVDDMSCRNLELLRNIRTGKRQGALIGVLDDTVTAMGGRLLGNWLRYPLLNKSDIEKRLDAVAEACGAHGVTDTARETLKSVHDLERLLGRIVMGHANARDLVSLKRSIQVIPNLLEQLSPFKSPLYHWSGPIDPLTRVAELIETAIREDAPVALNEGGLIKSGFNAELDELIQISRDGKGWLARLEAREKAATGIGSLKVRFNKVFGYYLEVPKVHSEKVPDHYVRKQTLVNAERYITDELKTFESKVLNAEERRASLEYDLFNQVRENIRERNDLIQEIAHHIARIDCLLNLSHVAARNHYCKPKITDDGTFTLKDARHPVIEKLISGERFVPNTIHLDDAYQQMLIITGPNMAGKSTVLRQAALAAVMAQMGSFVPAGSADLCIIDRIFTRVGALDNLSRGQSTFMVEMQETANILNNATPRSLVILDEIGRGTSTFDGLSIAWAVAEHLHDLRDAGVKTLFATHYHELTEIVEEKPRAKNFSIAVKEYGDDIIFLRKLMEGGTSRSYGIQVARLAGIPLPVIERAKEILMKIEADSRHHAGHSKIAEKLSRFAKKRPQMGLFQNDETRIIDSLRTLDITRLTPLDALNYLSDLKEKTKFH